MFTEIKGKRAKLFSKFAQNIKHLMTDPAGHSDFCFPKILNFEFPGLSRNRSRVSLELPLPSFPEDSKITLALLHSP